MALVNKKKGEGRMQPGRRGLSRISGLSCRSYPSEWSLVREAKGTRAQQQLPSAKGFVPMLPSCSGLTQERSLLTPDCTNPAPT